MTLARELAAPHPQPPKSADPFTREVFAGYLRMRAERDQARRFAVQLEQEAHDAQLRIANACALVDETLRNRPLLCTCDDEYRCDVHGIEHALRGAR